MHKSRLTCYYINILQSRTEQTALWCIWVAFAKQVALSMDCFNVAGKNAWICLFYNRYSESSPLF